MVLETTYDAKKQDQHDLAFCNEYALFPYVCRIGYKKHTP